MKFKLLLTFCCNLIFLLAHSQTFEIKGKVIDSYTGEPIVGVNISVVETDVRTTSGEGGLFLIKTNEGKPSLNFTYIGYENYQTLYDGSSPTVEMIPFNKDLEEVVVVGYGTQRKKDLTGAIKSIGSEDVEGRRTLQISESLQGTVGGVSVTRSSGGPGSGANILIRGITTIGTNSPLIIVDGAPVSNIDHVNPSDVENLTVLKDAASASIYGSRGAAGVILITTKRAKNGQQDLDYTYEYGFQRATAHPEYVGIQDYMRYYNEQLINDGGSAFYSKDHIDQYLVNHKADPDQYPNVDWQKQVFTNANAPRNRHELAFTSGTNKIKTKASLGYSKQGAFYDNFDYERLLFRVNNDLQVSEKMSVKLDLGYKRTNNNSTPYNPVFNSRVFPAYYADRFSDGRYAPGKDGDNPVAEINEGGFVQGRLNQFSARAAIDFKPIEGLTLTAMVAPIMDLDKSKTYTKQILYTDLNDISRVIAQNKPRTSLSESRTENLNVNAQLLANYNTKIADVHNLDVLLGFEENFRNIETLGASRDGFSLLGYPYLNAGSIELRGNSGTANESALHSFFGRVQYNYNNKYYLQSNLRFDKSSRFSKQFRQAVFPSVSAGWVVSDELFLKDFEALNFFKLRASWGQSGNERLLDRNGNSSYYPYQAQIDFTNPIFYRNGMIVPFAGGGQQVYAVENISWETSETLDIGADFSFLSNRLNVSVDYFDKKTFDILLPLDIPLYLGYDKPNQNAGELKVKGWELEVGWNDHIGNVKYSAAFNFSDAKSKIANLKGTEFLGDQIIRTGSEYNEWFGYQYSGIYQTEEELKNSPVMNANTKVGDFKYVDTNQDGIITPDDKVLLGGALPRYQYGGNLRAEYLGFDISLVFQGVGKKLSRLNSEIIQPFASGFGNFPTEMVGEYWSPANSSEENENAFYPRLSRVSNNSNYALSNHWLINGAYFRLKNITMGYTVESEVFKKAGISSLRFYAAGNDLFSKSNFPKYIDPEVGNYAYPISRTFLFGASIKF